MGILEPYIKMHIISASLATCREPVGCRLSSTNCVSVCEEAQNPSAASHTERDQDGNKINLTEAQNKVLQQLCTRSVSQKTRKKKKAAFNSQIDSSSMLPVTRSVSVNYDRQRSGCRATKLSVRREVWNQCCLSSFYTHRYTQVELRLLQSVCYFCLVILSIKK